MTNLKISNLSFLEEYNLSNSKILGGKCSVNYTFGGDDAEFSAVLQELEKRNYHEQAAHLTKLYNNGCIKTE